MTELVPAGIRDDGVVLLHGILRSSRGMRPLEKALSARGYQTLNLDYPSRRMGVAALADLLEAPVRRFHDRLAGRLHFVTHSMGGLVARALIRRHRPDRLGRVVMLAPPNQGSEIADLLGPTRIFRHVFGPAGLQLGSRHASDFSDAIGPVDFELGIIAGNHSIDPLGWGVLPKPNDGRVSVAATKAAAMTDHIILPSTHAFIMRSPAAIDATIRFLCFGRFH